MLNTVFPFTVSCCNADLSDQIRIAHRDILAPNVGPCHTLTYVSRSEYINCYVMLIDY